MARLSGDTRITGVLGWPVRHTLSPSMQNAAFEALGLDIVYLPFEVEPGRLGAAFEGIRALSILGVNVTIPHKVSAAGLLDELSREAALIGAVNTVSNREGRLTGYNTDGIGFVRSLRELGGFEPRGRSALILGAGGAARAIAFQLAIEGTVHITIANRNEERAQSLASDLVRAGFDCEVSWCALSDRNSFDRAGQKVDLLVNATSVGLDPKNAEDVCHLVPGTLDPGVLVCDIVCGRNSSVPPFLSEARKRGYRGIDGLGMLVYQGAASFEIWTGRKAPVEVMFNAIEKAQKA